MNRMIRVILVDDHQVIRQGLRSMLGGMPDIQVVAEAGSGAEAVAALAGEQIDLMLLDVRLEDMTGIELASLVSRMTPAPRIIMLSVHDDRFSVEQAFAAGAAGYLLKSVSKLELLSSIRRVAAGERVVSPALVSHLIPRSDAGMAALTHLTEEDVRLLQLLATGASNSEIAARVSWSEATVKRRLQRLYVLLQVTSRVEAVHVAGREGYL